MGSPIDGRKGPSAIKKAAATAARLLFPIVVGAVVAMAGVSLVAQPIWGDQSWLLYAASRILDGGRIGSDIVETNPPTIIWLSEIPVLLSRLLGVSPEAAMKICLGLLLFLSTTWCGSMVRRIPRAGSGAMAVWLAIGIAYGTTVYSWSDVGQREYILVLLMLPYLVMAALRLDGVSLAAWPAFTAGVITVVGLSMKPQHILIVAGIELLLACRIGLRRSVMRPEAVGGVIGGLAYCAAIAIFAPDYVTKVVPVVYRTYLDYQTLPLLTLIEPRRTAKLAALLLLWAFMRRRLQYRSLCAVLVIAGVGADGCIFDPAEGMAISVPPGRRLFHIAFRRYRRRHFPPVDRVAHKTGATHGIRWRNGVAQLRIGRRALLSHTIRESSGRRRPRSGGGATSHSVGFASRHDDRGGRSELCEPFRFSASISPEVGIAVRRLLDVGSDLQRRDGGCREDEPPAIGAAC